MTEFNPFPKIGRWYRDICITEKIDGTNASICIEEHEAPKTENAEMDLAGWADDPTVLHIYLHAGTRKVLVLRAGSRTRFLTRKTDNFGFAKWVQENSDELIKLGPGEHFGEWWGSGIQRGYGLTDNDKRFSLFNPNRWAPMECYMGVYPYKLPVAGEVVTIEVPGLSVVPVLYRGPMRHNETDFSPATDAIQEAIRRLRASGSQAAVGYKNPEGIMIYHEALQAYGQFTLDGDAAKGP